MNSNRTVPIPPLFLSKFEKLLPKADFPMFEAALDAQPVSGLRVNTLKMSVEEFLFRSPFKLDKRVDWCPQAFYLEGGDRPGQHPYHAAGLYYLQDPSAMVPAQLLAPQPGERILDLSAAPGGKTTQMAALMKGEGLLVANEIKNKRIGHLIQNVERWGASNVMVSNETPERLADTFGAIFDKVLVDAPCSGEGMFRKDQGARAEWSQEMVEGCAVRQQNILRVAVKLVRPGGKLLYSTCTFSPEEDEGVIQEILNKYPEMEVVKTVTYDGFDEGRPDWIDADPSLRNAVRLFPHKVAGEGHFACLLQKKGGQRPQELKHNLRNQLSKTDIRIWDSFAGNTLKHQFDVERLAVVGDRLYYLPEEIPNTGNLRIAHQGVWLGTIKKDRFEPAHPLALLLQADGFVNRHDLSSSSSGIASYLQGGILESEGNGWTVVTVDGIPLGWGKAVQGMLKNHYPKGWMR